MSRLVVWIFEQSFASWCAVSVAGNLVAAGVSIGACWALARLFHRRRIFEKPQPITASDVIFSLGAVALNSLISIVGWLLWKHGWIAFRADAAAWHLADAVMLIVVMDVAMYGLHRVAHHPALFRFVHASHHVHESTNPLSLFVLNPFEVLGFGALLLVVLVVHTWSVGAVVAYLTFNLVFGTIGHLGVEPFPAWMMKFAPFCYLGTSTFHGLHHAHRAHNFGFYTTVWDRLFKTLDPEYDAWVRGSG